MIESRQVSFQEKAHINEGRRKGKMIISNQLLSIEDPELRSLARQTVKHITYILRFEQLEHGDPASPEAILDVVDSLPPRPQSDLVCEICELTDEEPAATRSYFSGRFIRVIQSPGSWGLQQPDESKAFKLYGGLDILAVVRGGWTKRPKANLNIRKKHPDKAKTDGKYFSHCLC